MTMDAVFKAVADPSHRRLLDRRNTRNGQSLRELCDGLEHLARGPADEHAHLHRRRPRPRGGPCWP
jgi:hypothetical protein